MAYWEHGKLVRVTDCARTPEAIECRGDASQQRATTIRILNETRRALSTGQDKGAAVLFLAADGGEISCAGTRACSYMAFQPNADEPLPQIGASE